jgi:hypothetical protein
VQQALLILAYLYSHPGSVLLLDEPDAHLEIIRQREILDVIAEVAADVESLVWRDMQQAADLRIGSGAALLDSGLGKSLIEVEYGRVISEATNRPVLMLAPLAVGPQHEREAVKFGIDATYIRNPSEITGPGVWICNYERLHMFDPSDFGGLILDESSLLKSYGGKTSKALIDFGILDNGRLTDEVDYLLAQLDDL